jgi:hypothetical protein
MVAMQLIFLIAGLLCFVFAAFRVVTSPRIDLVPLGLAFWIATLIPGLFR